MVDHVGALRTICPHLAPELIRTTLQTMAEFTYTDLLPTGPDETPYRLLTSEGVSTIEAGGRTVSYTHLTLPTIYSV